MIQSNVPATTNKHVGTVCQSKLLKCTIIHFKWNTNIFYSIQLENFKLGQIKINEHKCLQNYSLYLLLINKIMNS